MNEAIFKQHCENLNSDLDSILRLNIDRLAADDDVDGSMMGRILTSVMTFHFCRIMRSAQLDTPETLEMVIAGLQAFDSMHTEH